MSHFHKLPPLQHDFGYELHAKLVEGGKERSVPIDVALPNGKKAPHSRFYLCGPGDEHEGFGLSGRHGVAVRLARRDYPGKSPRDLGLHGWIAGRYTTGDRLVLVPDLHLILS